MIFHFFRYSTRLRGLGLGSMDVVLERVRTRCANEVEADRAGSRKRRQALSPAGAAQRLPGHQVPPKKSKVRPQR